MEEEIELGNRYRRDFEHKGQRVSVIVMYPGTFMVLSDLTCVQESLPEIGDNESRVIGSKIPKTELYLAIATIIADEKLYEIKSFQFLEDEDKAIFIIR